MFKNKLNQIAIDGVSGCGKSTIAKKLALHYNFYYLSTGKIFRSFAYYLKDIDFTNEKLTKKYLKKIQLEIKENQFILFKKNITKFLISNEIGDIASKIAKQPFVRKKYEKIIKKIAKSEKIILEGRDITTVILPHAKYKFFLTASSTIRAKWRLKELNLPNSQLKTMIKKIENRDLVDTNRELSPLKKTKNAIEINTSKMNIDQVVNCIIKKISDLDQSLK